MPLSAEEKNTLLALIENQDHEGLLSALRHLNPEDLAALQEVVQMLNSNAEHLHPKEGFETHMFMVVGMAIRHEHLHRLAELPVEYYIWYARHRQHLKLDADPAATVEMLTKRYLKGNADDLFWGIMFRLIETPEKLLDWFETHLPPSKTQVPEAGLVYLMKAHMHLGNLEEYQMLAQVAPIDASRTDEHWKPIFDLQALLNHAKKTGSRPVLQTVVEKVQQLDVGAYSVKLDLLLQVAEVQRGWGEEQAFLDHLEKATQVLPVHKVDFKLDDPNHYLQMVTLTSGKTMVLYLNDHTQRWTNLIEGLVTHHPEWLKQHPDVLLLGAHLEWHPQRYEDEFPPSKMLEAAREWFPDHPWLLFILKERATELLESVRAQKRWIEVEYPQNNEVHRHFSFYWNPEYSTESPEEARVVHKELLHWPKSMAAEDVREVQDLLFGEQTWLDMLKHHQLHPEIVEAIQSKPDHMEDESLLFDLGLAALNIQKPQLAIEAYEKLVELQPENANAWNNLGVAHARHGDPVAAVWCYRQALLVGGDRVQNARNNLLSTRQTADRKQPFRLQWTEGSSPFHQSLAEKHWALKDNGKWEYPIKTLAEAAGVSNAGFKVQVASTCTAYSTSIFCENCLKEMVFLDRTQAEQRSTFLTRGWVCQDCTAAVARKRQQEVEQLRKQQLTTLQKRFDFSDSEPIWAENLSLREAIYLLSAIRTLASEDMTYLRPLKDATLKLSPSSAFSKEMLMALFNRGILKIHPASAPEAFGWKDGQPETFDHNQVVWGIPAGGLKTPFTTLTRELNERLSDNEWPQEWLDDLPEVQEDVMYQEALEYLHHQLQEYRFNFDLSAKTEGILRNMLHHHSVGQVWNNIYGVMTYTAARIQKDRLNKTHAANLLASVLQSRLEKALAEGWTIKPYGRDFNLQQSEVSKVLFVLALQRTDYLEGLTVPEAD